MLRGISLPDIINTHDTTPSSGGKTLNQPNYKICANAISAESDWD
jgi:hypothetical protein